MFGTLGTPEMIFIFLLALVLFGPKKLPELGRTVGKAITEFRRASNELKSTFDRELKNLETEANLKEIRQEVNNNLQLDAYNYDYSSYEHTYDGSYGETYDGAVSNPATESASATLDAGPTTALAIEGAPEGAIARGSTLELPPASEEISGEYRDRFAPERAPAD
jgi:TatA/E family protein of Tat protein translocase